MTSSRTTDPENVCGVEESNGHIKLKAYVASRGGILLDEALAPRQRFAHILSLTDYVVPRRRLSWGRRKAEGTRWVSLKSRLVHAGE
jgi:hypothetical protein